MNCTRLLAVAAVAALAPTLAAPARAQAAPGGPAGTFGSPYAFNFGGPGYGSALGWVGAGQTAVWAFQVYSPGIMLESDGYFPPLPGEPPSDFAPAVLYDAALRPVPFAPDLDQTYALADGVYSLAQRNVSGAGRYDSVQIYGLGLSPSLPTGAGIGPVGFGVVPEPSPLALLAAGLAGAGLAGAGLAGAGALRRPQSAGRRHPAGRRHAAGRRHSARNGS